MGLLGDVACYFKFTIVFGLQAIHKGPLSGILVPKDNEVGVAVAVADFGLFQDGVPEFFLVGTVFAFFFAHRLNSD